MDGSIQDMLVKGYMLRVGVASMQPPIRPERHYRVTEACFLRKRLKFSLKWNKGETSLRETLRE